LKIGKRGRQALFNELTKRQDKELIAYGIWLAGILYMSKQTCKTFFQGLSAVFGGGDKLYFEFPSKVFGDVLSGPFQVCLSQRK
jgi:hypothetical protein